MCDQPQSVYVHSLMHFSFCHYGDHILLHEGPFFKLSFIFPMVRIYLHSVTLHFLSIFFCLQLEFTDLRYSTTKQIEGSPPRFPLSYFMWDIRAKDQPRNFLGRIHITALIWSPEERHSGVRNCQNSGVSRDIPVAYLQATGQLQKNRLPTPP